MKYDYLIIGSGLYGATFAYFAAKRGFRCLVIDKRPHLGGNIYCENIDGINVHKYGAHIFHTSNKKVWDFANSLVEFNQFINSPIANFNGELYNLPFNMNTFHRMWGVNTPKQAQTKIDEQRDEIRQLLKGREPLNLEEQALLFVGRDIYEKLIKGYTEKQWGRHCSELPAFIIRRLPVRFVYDNNYFNDTYQGIPIGGYNTLIDALLDGVDKINGIDYFEIKKCEEQEQDGTKVVKPFNAEFPAFSYRKLLFTGKIDEYFNYKFGKLEYRTVRFEEEIINKPNYQGNAVVNYTDRVTPYTRIIEHKHFESFGQAIYDNPHTVISREYSTEWEDGMEPYYPVNDKRNQDLYSKYAELAAKETNVIFGGRLAEYKYYDMAPIIERVMTYWNV
jgi:UDP-galactopyranose mutase